jgi:hypothetical protein
MIPIFMAVVTDVTFGIWEIGDDGSKLVDFCDACFLDETLA